MTRAAWLVVLFAAAVSVAGCGAGATKQTVTVTSTVTNTATVRLRTVVTVPSTTTNHIATQAPPRKRRTPAHLAATQTTSTSGTAGSRYCFGPYTIPAVRLPAITIPATTIPATTLPASTLPASTLGGVTYPAQTYPAQTYPSTSYPAVTYPAQTIQGSTVPHSCVTLNPRWSRRTTIRVSNYAAIDPTVNVQATSTYWHDAGAAATLPDFSASGFGELNDAGFPKNQYVRPYVRKDGTVVSGYWRNSPSDGYPTCKIINC